VLFRKLGQSRVGVQWIGAVPVGGLCGGGLGVLAVGGRIKEVEGMEVCNRSVQRRECWRRGRAESRGALALVIMMVVSAAERVM